MRYAKWATGVLLMALMLSKPQEAAYGAARAMARWYVTVAPSLFPFLVLMPLFTGKAAADAYQKLMGGAMKVFFRLPGAAAPAMFIGMIAGTPAGAVAARRVAAESGINRGQLHRLAIAATGFSPAFLVSGIGMGMLGDAQAGWQLLAVQVMTQLTMAALFRGIWKDRVQPVVALERGTEASPVRGAVSILLIICGYMAFFGSITCVLSAYMGPNAANVLLCVLDVPSGALMMARQDVSIQWKLILLAAMCGFGGLCVIAQSQGALRDCRLGLGECLALRTAAAGISAGYMALWLKLSDIRLPEWMGDLKANPLAWAGLAASLLAIPILIKLAKSIS